MALNLLLPLLLLCHFLPPVVQSQLTLDYYKQSCPDFSKIVLEVVTEKQVSSPNTAAGTLRLFFHDCIVGGCDASLLISSKSASTTAERDSDDNKALPADAFDVVIRANAILELKCPGVVSCADILAEATRDLVSMVGGPSYRVPLGRRDAAESHAEAVNGHIPRSNMSLPQIIDIFTKQGFTVQEMVALVGAHTIGFSHCSEFASRIFNSNGPPPQGPPMNPEYADQLRKHCANYIKDPSIAALNDPTTPGKFDNAYYQNLQKGMGLLASDQFMAIDPQTKPSVDLYAANQTAFFEAFSTAMDKLSALNVLTGDKGEIRKRCDAANKLTTW